MANRLKQFYRACTAKVDDQDLIFVKSWLSDNELALFLRMSIIDQKHCINVASTAQTLGKNWKLNVPLLMRAALLHDCGRKDGDLGLIGKSIAVLYDKIFGYKRFTSIKTPPRMNLYYKLYQLLRVYYHHPELSAAELVQIQAVDELLEIILSHHKPATNEDRLELKVLKQADARN